MAIVMEPGAAMRALQEGIAPAGLHVNGYITWTQNTASPQFPADCFIEHLYISGVTGDIDWPTGIRCTSLWITECRDITALPDDLIVTESLTISGCPRLANLPSDMRVAALTLRDCPLLKALPCDMRVLGELTIQGCPQIESLPDRLEVSQIDVSGCRGLRRLPHGIQARYVNIANCTALEAWDDPSITSLRQLDARGCRNLRQLPPNLYEINQLDVSGCEQLAELPQELVVREWLDIGGTQIRALPQAAQPYRLRWNGVHVSGQIAFHPETITAAMIFSERNAELRRVMVERVGTERFLAQATPTLRDSDTDPGGQRRLLVVRLPGGDEPLVVLQVHDPSTGRRYLIRVPPRMRTCHQAAAWIAGFDDPDQYHPIAES
ncbi:MAG: DUF6745 domain-containing protein [Ktedonobacterales bacterium]